MKFDIKNKQPQGPCQEAILPEAPKGHNNNLCWDLYCSFQ